MDVAACRAAFEQAELRRMVEGWGLSRAGAAAVCAARPPVAAEDAAARLLGAPAVVTATPVPPPGVLPPPPHSSSSLRPGVAPWLRGAASVIQYLLAVRTSEPEE